MIAIVSYHEAMRTVTVADLKNNLSRYLREIRSGERFTVLIRDVPVAQLTPLEAAGRVLEVRPARAGALPPGRAQLPEPMSGLEGVGDIVELLLAERGER